MSHAAGAQLCVGADAYPRTRLAGPEGECTHRLVTLPQSRAGAEAARAVPIAQCTRPRDCGFCRGPTAEAADSGLGGWRLCDQGHAATPTRAGRRGLADA